MRKTTARHTEYPTQRSNAMSVTLLIDEAVLYSASLAKYRADFFKISRSSSTRWS